MTDDKIHRETAEFLAHMAIERPMDPTANLVFCSLGIPIPFELCKGKDAIKNIKRYIVEKVTECFTKEG